MEVPRDVLQRPHPLAVLEPVLAFFELLEGCGRFPAHPAAEVQLLLALEGGFGMFHIAEHLLEPASDRVGRWQKVVNGERVDWYELDRQVGVIAGALSGSTPQEEAPPPEPVVAGGRFTDFLFDPDEVSV